MYGEDPKHPTLIVYKWQFSEETVNISEKKTKQVLWFGSEMSPRLCFEMYIPSGGAVWEVI